MKKQLHFSASVKQELNEEW